MTSLLEVGSFKGGPVFPSLGPLGHPSFKLELHQLTYNQQTMAEVTEYHRQDLVTEVCAFCLAHPTWLSLASLPPFRAPALREKEPELSSWWQELMTHTAVRT
jgi:hypothetical protein